MIPFDKRHAVKGLAHRHFRAQTREEAVAQYLYTAMQRRAYTVQFREKPSSGPQGVRTIIRECLAKARRIRDANNWEPVYIERLGTIA